MKSRQAARPAALGLALPPVTDSLHTCPPGVVYYYNAT